MQEIQDVKGRALGRKIKKVIIDAADDESGRWTQQRVADAVGIGKDHLSKVINGKAEISIETLNEIAVLFDVCFSVEINGAESLINHNGSATY